MFQLRDAQRSWSKEGYPWLYFTWWIHQDKETIANSLSTVLEVSLCQWNGAKRLTESQSESQTSVDTCLSIEKKGLYMVARWSKDRALGGRRFLRQMAMSRAPGFSAEMAGCWNTLYRASHYIELYKASQETELLLYQGGPEWKAGLDRSLSISNAKTDVPSLETLNTTTVLLFEFREWTSWTKGAAVTQQLCPWKRTGRDCHTDPKA